MLAGIYNGAIRGAADAGSILRTGKVTKLYSFKGLDREEVAEAGAGDPGSGSDRDLVAAGPGRGQRRADQIGRAHV